MIINIVYFLKFSKKLLTDNGNKYLVSFSMENLYAIYFTATLQMYPDYQINK